MIDRDTAARLGITPRTRSIRRSYDAFGQRQVSTMYTPLNQYHVVMEVAPAFWQQPETLNGIYVRRPHGDAGAAVARFATFGRSTTPLVGQSPGRSFRRSRSPSICAPGASLGDAVTRDRCSAARDIGMPTTHPRQFPGNRAVFQASLASEPLLILAALVAVYIVLGILYES